VDPRAGLDDVEKRKFLTLPGLEPRPLSRPARSQSLYRLCYPGYLSHLCSSLFALRSSLIFCLLEILSLCICWVHMHVYSRLTCDFKGRVDFIIYVLAISLI
jgi:hypothetical protein